MNVGVHEGEIGEIVIVDSVVFLFHCRRTGGVDIYRDVQVCLCRVYTCCMPALYVVITQQYDGSMTCASTVYMYEDEVIFWLSLQQQRTRKTKIII